MKVTWCTLLFQQSSVTFLKSAANIPLTKGWLSMMKTDNFGNGEERNRPRLVLRNATLNDLETIQRWGKAEHVRKSIGDYDFDEWNWEYELPRNPSWRYQLIAQVDNTPIGFVQIIDPLLEETHYWGLDCEPNLRALDVWIGEEDFLGKGWGTRILTLALNDYCFSDGSGAEAVLVDPKMSNTRAHVFYQRLGFEPVGSRYFGSDHCFIHRLDRHAWELRRRNNP